MVDNASPLKPIEEVKERLAIESRIVHWSSHFRKHPPNALSPDVLKDLHNTIRYVFYLEGRGQPYEFPVAEVVAAFALGGLSVFTMLFILLT